VVASAVLSGVVVLGLAARDGTPISFWTFTRYGAIVAGLTIALAAPYVWLRYFVYV
jgi:Na+/H+ antiporter NhaD/arsenite permease-like protein